MRSPEITLALLGYAPDIIALCEVRSTFGGQIAGVLADHGWTHQRSTFVPRGGNGLLIASRVPIEPGEPAGPGIDPRRWLDVRVSEVDWRLSLIHVPHAHSSDRAEFAKRVRYFRGLIEHARRRSATRHVIIGDANIGRHRVDEPGASFTCTPMLGELLTLGYIDAWKTRNPLQKQGSWRSHTGQERRIDHAFVSTDLAARVSDARYHHGARLRGLSDHSPLEIQFETEVGGRKPRKK